MSSTFLIFLILSPVTQSYRILCLLPFGGSSHQQMFLPIINELLFRGHHITAIWSGVPPISHANLQSISIVQPGFGEDFRLKKIFQSVDLSPLLYFKRFPDFVVPACTNYVVDKKVQNLFKNTTERFDLAIISGFMNECALTTAPIISNTVIILSSNVVFPWVPFDDPRIASFVPNMMIPYTDQMTFIEKMLNLFYAFAIRALHDYHLIPQVQQVVFKYLPQAPLFEDAMKKVALILTNVDPVITSPRPTTPNVINIGGIHCKKAIKLPKEFEEFINSAGENGFIYFSFGSNVQCKNLPREKFNAFIKAFSRLKQNVIWKYEENSNFTLPSNVKMSKWLPQQDLLGDKRIRLFITHGGLLSTQQAVYHSVPILGIPLFADQPGNIGRMLEHKMGLLLSFNNITENNVFSTIKILLEDPSYARNAKFYSTIFKDRPDPIETAIYWIEYVIRYKGAEHLRNKFARITFFQYYSLDLFFYFLLSIFLIFILLKFSCNVPINSHSNFLRKIKSN